MTRNDVDNPDVPEDASGAGEGAIELREAIGKSQGQIVRERFFRHRGAMAALIILVGIVILGFSSVGFWFVPGWWEWAPGQRPDPDVHGYRIFHEGGRPTITMPWSEEGFGIGPHPFGQDDIGRDMFAQVMRGIQTSTIVMVIIGIAATFAGVVIGSVAGFFRGAADQVLMRMTDLVITLPTIALGAVLGRIVGAADPVPLALALGAVTWTGLSRLVRAEFLSLREREFVDAARVAGASNVRIIFKHMLPNAMGVIIVAVTLLMSSAILLETSLSYLGFGITLPNVSLGLLISEYETAFATRPWLFWWPGLFIVALALCVNFIGDGLRDAFDPRQRRIPSARKLAAAERKLERRETKDTNVAATS
ncbi:MULTISPECIES: ABC transporter permease [unclassified Pseudactinotalea]|uniref:ABC transporter permease n=1 Tax=Micrococcales TaxID=85006 RepID=UPI003C79926B